MGSVNRSQLSTKMLHVNIDGMLGNQEQLRDISIPVSLGGKAENIQRALRDSFVAELLGQMRRYFRRKTLLSGMDLADCIYQIGFN